MSCSQASVDYTYGHIDFTFNQGDSVILSFQFLDDEATEQTGVDVPIDITGKIFSIKMVTPDNVLAAVLSREDALGIVCAEFDQKETDKLADRSKHHYKVLVTDADGREFTPVVGYVRIGGHSIVC